MDFLKLAMEFLILLTVAVVQISAGEPMMLVSSDSLAYGGSRGKGKVPMQAQTIVKPIIVGKKEAEEVVPIKTLVHTNHMYVHERQPTLQYSHPKIDEENDVKPVCLEPYMLGIAAIRDCDSLQMVSRAQTQRTIVLQKGLEECQFLDDLSCDDGSGRGFQIYINRIQAERFAVSAHTGSDIGPCLGVRKTVTGSIEVHIPISHDSTIICCRLLCLQEPTASSDTAPTSTTFPTITTTTTTVAIPMTTTTTQPTEALLPLSDTTPLPEANPPISNNPISAPPVEDLLSSLANYLGHTASSQMTVVTTAAPSTVLDEMCVIPRFLGLPRVTNCLELRDVALSTSYVELLDKRLADCMWIDDTSCKPVYPGLGAFLDSPAPSGACLAYRQTSCANVIGTFPIVGKQLRDICKEYSGHYAGGMQFMMMPIPIPKGKMGRRLDEVFHVTTADDRKAEELVYSGNKDQRRLHGKNPIPSKERTAVLSDSVVICCRLTCNTSIMSIPHGRTAASSSASIITSDELLSFTTNSYDRSRQIFPNNRDDQLISNGRRDISNGRRDISNWNFGENFPSAEVRSARTVPNESDLCNQRYWRICSLATPLIGEKIIFDQRCMNENLPGCYAGGMPCCRSVPLLQF